MCGKTREQLAAIMRKLVDLAIENEVARPENFEAICKKIRDGDQDARDSAQKDLAIWAKQISTRMVRSVSPTPEHVQQVLNPRRDAFAQVNTNVGIGASTVASPTLVTTRSSAEGSVSSQPLPKPQSSAPTMEFGKDIARFALLAAKEKKQIGDGQCWTLANQAMLKAGASPPMNRSNPLNFGRLVGEIKPNDKTVIAQAQAGDLLQYYNVTIEIVEGTTTSTITAKQHTAIVAAPPVGHKLKVIQSNLSGDLRPALADVDFDGMRYGTVRVWRAVAL